MSLRGFLSAVSVFILAFILLGAAYIERHLVEKRLQELNGLRIESVVEFTLTVVQAKQYLLSTFGEALGQNSELARAFLMSDEIGKKHLNEILESVRRSTRCDVVSISKSRSKISGFTTMNGEPYLVGVFPIRLYKDPIGQLTLGYRANGILAREITAGTQSRVSFLPGIKNGRDSLKTNLNIEDRSGERVREDLRSGLIVAGGLTLIAVALLLYVLVSVGFLKHFRSTISSINLAAEDLQNGVIRLVPPRKYPIREITSLHQSFEKLMHGLTGFQERVRQKTRTEAAGEKAAQVAHDIHGPLTALEMAVSLEGPLSVERRDAVRGLVERIRKIVSLVAEKSVSLSNEERTFVDISDAVSTIVSEKRMQHSARPIDFIFSVPPSELALVQRNEFLRIVSNILENAVESIADAGVITLTLHYTPERVELTVADTGRGIPAAVLARIGERGFTFGKENGSGLGIWHATETIKTWGATLTIESNVGQGTDVSLRLPRRDPRLSELGLKTGSQIIILDDDERVHEIWRERFRDQGIHERNYQIFHFAEVAPFLEWLDENPEEVSDRIFLFDYDLSDPVWDGLKLITSLQLEKQAVLVTSHGNRPDLILTCQKLGLALIPKSNLRTIKISKVAPTSREGGLLR